MADWEHTGVAARAAQALHASKNPSIQYRARLLIAGHEADAPAMQALSRAVQGSAPVVRLLSRLGPDGLWSGADYGALTWVHHLTACAELGVCRCARLDAATRQALHALESGPEGRGGYTGCSDALTLRALMMLGYAGDAQLARLLQAFAQRQLPDGGYACTRLIEKKPGRKSCYKASLAALLLCAQCRALGLPLPGEGELRHYFLRRRVLLTSDLSAPVIFARPGWGPDSLFFPPEPMRIGQQHILHALCVLGAAHAPEMADVWHSAQRKQLPDGLWPLEGTLSRMPAKFGAVGEANEWVTLYMAGAFALKDRAAGRQG